MSTLRNPRETIVRQVFVYPANGDDPHVTGMKFSEAGANHRKGLYTTAVDLRALYGKSLHSGVGYTTVGIENQPDKTEIEGDYMVYYNLDLKLPLNLALARLVGINPKRPGSRPTWRGDVVVVKSREWPGPLIMGGGAHMDWLNVSPAVEGSLEIFFKRWYASKEWELKIEEERSILEIFKQPSDPLISMMEKVLNNAPKRNYEKDERTLEKLQKYRDKQIVREATYKCIACGSLGNPDLKKCSGCREVMYCSKECQRLDWEAHKRNCRKPRSCCRVV